MYMYPCECVEYVQKKRRHKNVRDIYGCRLIRVELMSSNSAEMYHM